ncbi:MAG: CPBP family intramembrane metalloprotease [Clostridia bacterium]|nr:CPBP family intramembrane metalloprotease [Clostridia bacterium]
MYTDSYLMEKRGTDTLILATLLYIAMQLAAAVLLLFAGDGVAVQIVISAVCVSGVAILFPALLAIVRGGAKRYGLLWPGWGVVLLSAAAGVGIFMFSTGINAFAMTAMEALGANPDIYAQQIPAAATVWETVFYIAMLALVPAVCEELLFRSVYVNSWRGMGRWKVVLVTSAIFALAHMTPASIVSFFVIGAVLGLLTYETRSVYPAMIIHFINNTISIWLSSASFDSAQAEAIDNVSTTQLGAVLLAAGALVAVPALYATFRLAKRARSGAQASPDAEGAPAVHGDAALEELREQLTQANRRRTRRVIAVVMAAMALLNALVFALAFVQL